MNRLTFIFFALFICLSSTAKSEIYRSVDEAGNAVFSDLPQAGSEKMDLPELTIYESPQRKEIKADNAKPSGLDGKQNQAFAPYSRFRILRPANKDTIRNNAGTVPVELQIIPALQVKLGHRIVLHLDGKKVASITVPKYKLAGIDRGAHTLAAKILDKKGKVLKSSSPVSFYLHRFSKLFKKSLLLQPQQKTTPSFSSSYKPDYSIF